MDRLSFIPAGFGIFVKTGPCSFDGLIGFWIPFVLFMVWVFVMTWFTLAAIEKRERRVPLAFAAVISAFEIEDLARPPGAAKRG